MTHQVESAKVLASRLAMVAIVLIIVALWFVLTPKPVPELIFPSPASAWSAIQSLGFSLVGHAATTFTRVVLGWSLGVIFGVAFGTWISWSRFAYEMTRPMIEVVRPLPPIALIPFFIIWFGIGPFGQIFLVFLGVFMVLMVQTYTCIQNLPPVFVRAASSLGASDWEIYRTVVLPGIIPGLLGALRVSAALAFGIGVAAEYMGAQSGLGFIIMVARRTLNTNTILVGTMLIGLESLALDVAIRRGVAAMTRWAEDPATVSTTTSRGEVL